MKTFYIGALLSVTNTYLLTPHMRDTALMLNYMSGEKLHTFDLPRVSGEATPYLYEQHPWLREITDEMLGELLAPYRAEIHRAYDSGADDAALWACLDKVLQPLIEKHGRMLEVPIMRPEDHVRLSPEESLRKSGFTGEIFVQEVDPSNGKAGLN